MKPFLRSTFQLFSLSTLFLPDAAAGAFAPIAREDAGRAVCVTGVVTCVAYWQKNSCVIAAPDDVDGPAIYVAGEHPEADYTAIEGGEIEVGDVLEVAGEAIPMFFSPGIAAGRYKRLGKMALGPAPARTIADFSQGLLDNRRAGMEGVVTTVRPLSNDSSAFFLATKHGTIETRVRAPAEAVRRLSDAEVRVDGIAMSKYNHRAEYLGARIEVDCLDCIKVLKAAPEDVFSAKELPPRGVMSWTPEGLDGHRRLAHGTVTASNLDGTFYIQRGDLAIRASVDSPCKAPPPGASIDAVGFPEMIGGAGQLAGVIWRFSAAPPEKIVPIEIGEEAITNLDYGADMTFKDYDCRLVTLDGRLYRIERKNGSFDMFLDVGGVGVGASVRGDVPEWLAREEEFMPVARITGIARLDTSGELANGHRPRLSSFSVEVPDSNRIRIIPDDEWRRRHRAVVWQKCIAATAVILALLIAAGAWALWRAKTRERESRILANERERMAGDLHDTIEQHLAGAKILLSTAAGKLGDNENAPRQAVKMASEILAEAKRQIRDVVLNLKGDGFVKASARELITKIANEIEARGIARVRLRLKALKGELSAGEKSDLVAIVQQAVTNAVNHGKAKNIAIVADGERDGFVLRILNDGAPFDAAKALGPESGHFGLANMRERAKRGRMAIEWLQEGKWVCVKVTKQGIAAK